LCLTRDHIAVVAFEIFYGATALELFERQFLLDLVVGFDSF
jgi:hypothetical protein